MNPTKSYITYTNGNYKVKLYDDGAKIRLASNEIEAFSPDFAENIDLKICDFCDMGCPMCHEGSTTHGGFADIMNEPFIDTLHPYQEIAIGGGDATAHPDLIPFLKKLKEKNVIANLTVNQEHFECKQYLIHYLVDEDLIKGLGISFTYANEEALDLIKLYPNAVIHLINGMITPVTIDVLKDKGFKVLILGYKQLRRGERFYNTNGEYIKELQNWLYQNIESIIKGFKYVGFDNLALEQLDIKRLFSPGIWSKVYMGGDGKYTFYIDAVNREFAANSTALDEERYDLLDSVDDMFNVVRYGWEVLAE